MRKIREKFLKKLKMFDVDNVHARMDIHCARFEPLWPNAKGLQISIKLGDNGSEELDTGLCYQ